MSDRDTAELLHEITEQYLMFCPECGVVVVRRYTEPPEGGEKLEHCDVCDADHVFQEVADV